ncbi:MAG: FAD-dependent oxidoreductase, partial [Proteobacteria bacterium]|nr:FAD-dependent oxidoreductase [Pseudomonadota bacterium]
MAGLVTGESIVVPDKKLEGMGINVIVGEAIKVDALPKKVYLSDGNEITYDKLFLATGASPFVPPIEGHNLNGVLVLRSLPDADKIRAFIADKKPKKLIFAGAGFITLEVASLLAEKEPDAYGITVVEMMNRPLPLMLDEDMAALVKDYLEEKGLKILTGEKVEKILNRDGDVAGVELGSGKKLDADMVFMNVGSRPNLKLAKDIGLEIG